MHQAVKYDFTAHLTGIGKRSEEVARSENVLYRLLVRHIDADIRGVNTYVRLT